MSMTRAVRKLICQVLVGVLLFAQFSVASHACPALMNMPEGVSSAPSDERSMDSQSPNLCAEHCRFGQQSADVAAAPMVAAAILTALYALPSEPEASARASTPATPFAPAPAASPPHAILHCCFRI
ncbi:MAG TPA: hypothetical protein VKI18_13705 [Albitalea sp.]|nr:hypothetical protein [Albitalea sp.]